MKAFIHPLWRDSLKASNLNSFDDFWSLDLPVVDEVNERRNGWGYVSRFVLDDGRAIYIKRQLNQIRRNLQHPFSGESTYAVEYRYFRRFAQLGIDSLTAVYFATRCRDGQHETLLVTAAEDEFMALDEMDFSTIPAFQRYCIGRAVGAAVAKMHSHHLVHWALYPKHIFIRQRGPAVDVKLIDLEGVRKVLRQRQLLRDLDSLFRRTEQGGNREWVAFLQGYLGCSHLGAEGRTLFAQILARASRK